MLLAIDIGNTNISLGVFPITSKSPEKKIHHQWRLSTNITETADGYGTKILDLFRTSALEPSHVGGIALASVVPPLDKVFQEMGKIYFKKEVMFVDSRLKTGVPNLYSNPDEVGADRIVNAVAAFEHVKGASIVIDFGTATTFDCTNSKGEYLGGVIVPGPEMAAEGLAKKTAKLPFIGAIRRPQSALGKSTLESIQSGIFYGYKGMILEILGQLKKEMGGTPFVMATGGLSPLFSSHIQEIQECIPDLTLKGLRLLWIKNT